MIPLDYIELMNGEIDGTNTAAESRRLQEYLAGSSEAVDHFRELRRAVAVLDGLQSVDPPTHLRQRILDAVEATHGPEPITPSARPGTSFGGLRTLWQDLHRRPGYRLAFTTGFAVSLLLTVMVWQLTPYLGPIAPDALCGTIRRQVESGHGVRGIPVVVDQDDLAGIVCSYKVDSRTLVQFVLTSDRPATFKLLGNGPIACESYRATPPAQGDLTVTGQQITLTLRGAGEYDIVLHHLEAITPELRLQVLDDQTVLFEQRIAWEHN